MLYVHGWPASGATFRRLLPHLADRFTCHLIDLPGAGDSRWTADPSPSIGGHIAALREVVDLLGLDGFGVVGHDSGGLIARHALGGDPRVRAMALIDTEHPNDPSLLFRAFAASRHTPGGAAVLRFVTEHPRVARNRFVFGGAFVDRSLLGGDFDEFFLRPLREDAARRDAAVSILRSFGLGYVRSLAGIHPRIEVPVRLVWGERDPFFPVRRAREMVGQFPDASLTVVAGAALFSHEERPLEVATAVAEGLAVLDAG